MKLDVVFHYEVDETTGEIKYIGKDEISVDTAARKSSGSKSTAKKDENPEPLITLDPNKLILTQGAVDLLEVCPDCRVDIKYKKKGKQSVPIIGTDSAFGTKAGNKLTKSNTVSYRGANNEKLASYGTTFKLEPTEDKGIYYLVGEGTKSSDEEPEEIVNIEEALELEELDDINIDLDDENLENFDFKL